MVLAMLAGIGPGGAAVQHGVGGPVGEAEVAQIGAEEHCVLPRGGGGRVHVVHIRQVTVVFVVKHLVSQVGFSVITTEAGSHIFMLF